MRASLKRPRRSTARVRSRKGFGVPGGKPLWTRGLQGMQLPPELRAWLRDLDPEILEVIRNIEAHQGHKAWPEARRASVEVKRRWKRSEKTLLIDVFKDVFKLKRSAFRCF